MSTRHTLLSMACTTAANPYGLDRIRKGAPSGRPFSVSALVRPARTGRRTHSLTRTKLHQSTNGVDPSQPALLPTVVTTGAVETGRACAVGLLRSWFCGPLAALSPSAPKAQRPEKIVYSGAEGNTETRKSAIGPLPQAWPEIWVLISCGVQSAPALPLKRPLPSSSNEIWLLAGTPPQAASNAQQAIGNKSFADFVIMGFFSFFRGTLPNRTPMTRA